MCLPTCSAANVRRTSYNYIENKLAAWEVTGIFPVITYCDIDIRILANIQTHTVQCVLVVNIFLEKLFVILWFWYMFLLFATTASFFDWAFSTLPFEARKR